MYCLLLWISETQQKAQSEDIDDAGDGADTEGEGDKRNRSSVCGAKTPDRKTPYPEAPAPEAPGRETPDWHSCCQVSIGYSDQM